MMAEKKTLIFVHGMYGEISFFNGSYMNVGYCHFRFHLLELLTT